MAQTTTERFAYVVQAIIDRAGVTHHAGGSDGLHYEVLRIGESTFAFIGDDKFVVKLPRVRADQLEATGFAKRLNPNAAEPTGAWLQVLQEQAGTWLQLAQEALQHAKGAASVQDPTLWPPAA